MADATPKAEELAKEKGVDLDSVKGSGKDGRVLVEDVEQALEAKDEGEEAAAEEAEAPEEAAGDRELEEPEQSLRSVEAYQEHPHVDPAEQTPEERKDFDAGSLAAAGVLDEEDLILDDEDEAPVSDPEEAAELAADEDRELLSQESILSRGQRERGFFNIPVQENPHHMASLREGMLAEEAEVLEKTQERAAEAAAGAEASATGAPDAENARPAQQEGVVDTSGGDSAPTHGESLEDKSPAVAEVSGDSDDDKTED